jgi:hypothetical protein
MVKVSNDAEPCTDMPVILLDPSRLRHEDRESGLVIEDCGSDPFFRSYVYAHPKKVIEGIAAVRNWRH